MECCEIPLNNGMVALVDPEDYEWLMQWKWRARLDRRRPDARKYYYATRTSRFGEFDKRVEVSLHREILGLKRGDSRFGDHINGNTLDNRRSNLRIASSAQNQWNQGICAKNTSGHNGVSAVGSKWRAIIKVDGKHIWLGTFPTKEQAFEAYKEAAVKLHGEFARVA